MVSAEGRLRRANPAQVNIKMTEPELLPTTGELGRRYRKKRNPKDADHILQVFNVPRGLGTANATIDHKLRSSFAANGTASPPALLG